MNRISRLLERLGAGLLLAACALETDALVINVDLDDGTLTGGTFYSTNVLTFDSPLSLGVGETARIRVNFEDAVTGARQHLELADEPRSVPLESTPIERIMFGFYGEQTSSGLGAVSVSITDVTLIDVTGDLESNGFDSTDPLCVIFALTPEKVSCQSHIGTGPDLTDTTFSFHGFEFDLTLDESRLHSGSDFEPIVFQEGQFFFEANEISHGAWPVPEPMTAIMVALGFVGLGASRSARRMRAVSASSGRD